MKPLSFQLLCTRAPGREINTLPQGNGVHLCLLSWLIALWIWGTEKVNGGQKEQNTFIRAVRKDCFDIFQVPLTHVWQPLNDMACPELILTKPLDVLKVNQSKSRTGKHLNQGKCMIKGDMGKESFARAQVNICISVKRKLAADVNQLEFSLFINFCC